ncbi:MAG: TIGR04086 family membrane protein, partial [Turicibacter sp.]|nr:TIGR04086 family membrane protein [Turicibacter sp.]
MSKKLGTALLHGSAFIVISILIFGLLITTFAYFEWISVSVLNKLIYVAFVAPFFVGTALISKKVEQKGWLVGICVATVIVLLSLLFYTIGIEAPLTFKFFVRSLITFIICITGG